MSSAEVESTCEGNVGRASSVRKAPDTPGVGGGFPGFFLASGSVGLIARSVYNLPCCQGLARKSSVLFFFVDLKTNKIYNSSVTKETIGMIWQQPVVELMTAERRPKCQPWFPGAAQHPRLLRSCQGQLRVACLHRALPGLL